MSVVCVLTPMVVAGWPAFSSAVVTAATGLGYQVVADQSERAQRRREEKNKPTVVHLELPRSEIVTDQISRDREITVSREGVHVTFSRDSRDRAGLSVSGVGHSEEELKAMGEELSRGVIQSYIHQKLVDEMEARNLVIVEEEHFEDRTIRLKVRQWEP